MQDIDNGVSVEATSEDEQKQSTKREKKSKAPCSPKTDSHMKMMREARANKQAERKAQSIALEEKMSKMCIDYEVLKSQFEQMKSGKKTKPKKNQTRPISPSDTENSNDEKPKKKPKKRTKKIRPATPSDSDSNASVEEHESKFNFRVI